MKRKEERERRLTVSLYRNMEVGGLSPRNHADALHMHICIEGEKVEHLGEGILSSPW